MYTNTPATQIPATKKTCTGCAQDKAITAFASSKNGRQGLSAKCRACVRDQVVAKKMAANPFYQPRAPKAEPRVSEIPGAVWIGLTEGRYALIDEADLPLVQAFQWCHGPVRGKSYAIGYVEGKMVRLHRFLLDAAPGQPIDHINGDGLDCRRSNLRLATTALNAANRPRQANCQSGFKGVHRRGSRWGACIGVNGRVYHLGSFMNRDDAARAYDFAAVHAFGPFAYTNHGTGSVTSVEYTPAIGRFLAAVTSHAANQ